MKMMNKFCALMLSVALCAGMAAPAFAYLSTFPKNQHDTYHSCFE